MKNKSTLLFLLVAIVLAALTAIGANYYIKARADRAAAGRIRTVPVVVAKQAIEPGVTFSAANLIVQQWPSDSLPKGSFRKKGAINGRVAGSRFIKGEIILEGKLAQKGLKGGMSAVVAEGMRAVTVKTNEVIGVAGYVMPGDRVDVIVTVDAEQYDKDPTSKLVLQDVKVLAVKQNTDPQSGSKKKSSYKRFPVVTLELPPEKAERLALASTQGAVLLALRNQGDHVVKNTEGVKLSAIFPSLKPQIPEPQPALTPESESAPPPPPPPPPSVEVIRGSTVSKQTLPE